MLNSRYTYNRKPTIQLNPLQLKMKKQVEQKIESEIYTRETVPCAVCMGSHFEQLAAKDRYGLDLSVVICKDCGLIQTNPRMNQHSYNAFYDIEYRPLYSGKDQPTEEYFRFQYNRGQKIWSYLTDSGVKLTADMFVLEVGCGAGGILLYFREKGCRVKGIDLGSSYIEYGKKQYNLDLHIGTIDTHIENHGDHPDLIIYSHVLEHFLDPTKEMRKAHEILNNTGTLYINVPGVKNLKEGNMDFFQRLVLAHTYYFTLRTLVNLAENSGFIKLSGDEVVRATFKKSTINNQQSTINNQQ